MTAVVRAACSGLSGGNGGRVAVRWADAGFCMARMQGPVIVSAGRGWPKRRLATAAALPELLALASATIVLIQVGLWRYAVDAARRREAQVRRFVDEVWNARNYEAAAELYDESYVNPFGTGPAARVEPIRRYHQAFSDLLLDVEEVIVAGDTVVLRATFRETDTGGYVGTCSLTGRAVNEWVVTITHFDADKVVREWMGADKLGMFIQLGVLEDPWPE